MKGIYLLSIDGKKYVGSTINLESRIYHHVRSLKSNKHENRDMQNAFNECSDFYWEFIEEVENVEKLPLLECYYVGYYNSIEDGFNRQLPTNKQHRTEKGNGLNIYDFKKNQVEEE